MSKPLIIYLLLLSFITSFGQWEMVDTSSFSHYRDLEVLGSDKVIFVGAIHDSAGVLIYDVADQSFDTTMISGHTIIPHSHKLNDSTVIVLAFKLFDTLNVFKTTDYGFTFNKIGSFNLTYGNCHDLHFVNDTLGFFAGANNGTGCHKTIDGGQTWEQIYDSSLTNPNIGACAIDHYFSSVFFVDGNGMAQSDDYGMNWQIKSSNLSNRSFSSVDFNQFNGDIVFGGMGAHGSPNFNYGVIAKTSDFGNTWTYTDIIEAYQIRDVEMVSVTEGYATGPYTTGGSHTVYKTYDGGSTWYPQEIVNWVGGQVSAHALKCKSVDTCYICGEWGTILQTFNGGVGIHDYDFAPLLAVYPNPVTDVLNLAGIPFDLKANYSIYSIDGRIIQTGRLEQSISVTDLITGTYLIRVYSEEGERTLKFMKN
ncbi:MAG: T9SS type A sorting domain-containing protein [Flavobacteriales bacterium]|nr:T9SS type A sorting domain-containing protein [Flavobacteriales bacterium]